MKSLFQNIRAGNITKQACEMQLKSFKEQRNQLTKDMLGRRLGMDLYRKKLAEMDFCVEMLTSIIDKFDDLKQKPLKTKIPVESTESDNSAYDAVSGLEKGRIDDEGPNFSTEG